MSGNPKFAILEKDGEEFFGPTEYVPESDDILYKTGKAETVLDRLDEFKNRSTKYIYTNGYVTGFEVFKTNSQTDQNKILNCSLGFTGDLLTSETYVEYDNEAVLRTVTYVHTYSGDDVTKTEISIS